MIKIYLIEHLRYKNVFAILLPKKKVGLFMDCENRILKIEDASIYWFSNTNDRVIWVK